jgi:surface antigen
MMTGITHKFFAVAALAGTLALTGCASDAGPNQTGGALLGAGLGALVGSQFGHGDGRAAMTALGAVAGLAVGSSIGKKLDNADRQRMRDAEARAYNAKVGETIVWNNPNNGNSGSVTPTRDGRRGNEYCREFQTEIIVGGQKEKSYGTACRQPDGSWKIVSG